MIPKNLRKHPDRRIAMKGLSANGSRAATRNSAIGGTAAMVADGKKRERTILLSFDWKSQDWTPTPPACQQQLLRQNTLTAKQESDPFRRKRMRYSRQSFSSIETMKA